MATKHKALAKFVKMHYADPKGQRLGQHFINKYVATPWPQLYYCEDESQAKAMILGWLSKNGFHDNLPPELTQNS